MKSIVARAGGMHREAMYETPYSTPAQHDDSCVVDSVARSRIIFYDSCVVDSVARSLIIFGSLYYNQLKLVKGRETVGVFHRDRVRSCWKPPVAVTCSYICTAIRGTSCIS